MDPRTLDDLSQLLLSALAARSVPAAMEDDDISVLDTPIESGDMSPRQSALEKQRATLQTYLGALPYECEAEEEMHAHLEHIVGRIAVCIKSKNWLVLTTWDGVLQCWLLMRYPMPKTTRAKLARLYYELCLIPGLEPRVIRSWADMLSRLLSSKPDQRRKLESKDLQLPWRPLWRVIVKELWPKRRLTETHRNVINVLMFVAEVCRRYFPSAEIPEMLSEFVPLLTQANALSVVPVITTFLPPTHTHLYIPLYFRLWEAYNSSVIDDRFIEACGELSEEHIAGKEGDAGEEGGAEWSDVGIWTEAQWTVLVGKALGSMNVPVGNVRGASTTAAHADTMIERGMHRIKKPILRHHALAKVFVYSMFLDGPIRSETPADADKGAQQSGFLAGSRALDSLDRLITSTESYFHPSNYGHWTLALTTFLQRLSAEFIKRWKEEQQPTCKTPVTRRLTPAIRRAFVTTLRTPALLAMFSKDPISLQYAQATLRAMAMIEPNLIMPEILERAYSGLEIVNETHRTTAVLNSLACHALPLVSEKVWLGGQKHILPLLELAIPGIDLNDPMKTLCTSMFIASVVQYIKVGDLSMQQGGVPLSGEPAEDMMEIDGGNSERLPDGVELGETPTMSREDERALARDSTAGFADWVTALIRRVLALYENLPEEGGKKNTTGGKMEEAVLKSLKGTLDILCLQLSDPLFDLVLKIVYEYGTTNARSNAVRAFGQLVACLARVQPEKTISKFLPFCVSQIKEELKHGASSIRTTSTHAAVPSDTTLHWNMSILRGCLGYGGAVILKYKEEYIELLQLLIDKTKSERGYSGTGRLIHRILHTVAGIYPINARFVNSEEWDDTSFNKEHNLYWGRHYEAEDVKIEWHVPCAAEVDFVIEILERIGSPALDKIDSLLDNAGHWNGIDRNDFCRYLHSVRSIWSGLPTLLQEGQKDVAHPCFYNDIEVDAMLISPLLVKAGFVLDDPSDPRYQKVHAYRSRFGNVIHRASVALRQSAEGEDHIDAVISVSKAIDVYLLEYAITRSNFDALQKSYTVTRDLNRLWPRQKENSRQAFVKRAQAYHAGRVYLHSLYRRRSALDDLLLDDLVELSLSPYTRVRRHAQAILQNACGYYLRSTRYSLPKLFQALAKGADPDRMKGALYLLWNKGIASYALADPFFHGQYLQAILECQHQEKPSIQKIITSISQDALGFLTEEAIHTDAYSEDIPQVEDALSQLSEEFSPNFIDQALVRDAVTKARKRAELKVRKQDEDMLAVLEIATRSTTHWRYVQIAAAFMCNLLRRDALTPPVVAKFFAEHCISPHPAIRAFASKAIVRLTAYIKIRTYSKTTEELWYDEWKSPLRVDVTVDSPDFLRQLQRPLNPGNPFYIDKLDTGVFAWTKTIKGYRPPFRNSIDWEAASLDTLKAIREVLTSGNFVEQLAVLLGQESTKNPPTLKLRPEIVSFIKSLSKMFGPDILQETFTVLDPLLVDNDRFRQRAGAELLAGLVRGSKHWLPAEQNKLWTWLLERLNLWFAQIKPDTLPFWERVFQELFMDRDWRRIEPLINWVLSQQLDFQGDSAFAMTKTLSMFNYFVDCSWPFFATVADRYMRLFLDNANTGYAEVRTHIGYNMTSILWQSWRPTYPSVEALLVACRDQPDPLRIRAARFANEIHGIARILPRWKEERLPPPRVSQSQYDKVGLTVLQWIWDCAHGPHPTLVFPYVSIMLPEILKMSELNDSSELQQYSQAVLYVISAVNVPPEYTVVIANHFLTAIKSSDSWRIRLNALPTLLVFFYRNLMNIPSEIAARMMDVLLECLSDENVEVREMAAKMLAGVVRCSQRQSIIPLRDRFVKLARQTKLPPRRDPGYAGALRTLHSAILGLCALIESTPYSVEPWMPPLTDILASHATDPIPVSTTIRKCASEFKKTHQDTWHKDQHAFDEDQSQNLSTMLVGTSYYA